MTETDRLDRPAVFISSSVETLPLAAALAARLEPHADVRLWDLASVQSTSPILASLTEQIAAVDLVVAILGPGDRWGGPATRPNAVFELGLAVGALGADRVVVAADKSASLPSLLGGTQVVVTDLHNAVALDSLAERIVTQLSRLGLRPKPARDSVTVFLSYALPDSEFVERLVLDLRRAGISSWIDSKVGEHWADRLGEAITASDRVLVVLSSSSVLSQWVRYEAEWARRQESRAGRTMLFPVTVDSAVLESTDPWVRELLKTSQVADSSHWRDRRAYERSLRRLLQALSISANQSS